ncbi:MAG: NUDIX hydrolase [Deltaproteobacteria bacterium]|nr:NUDIX hydrolase [Deltaproteobacteria bacterium]
MTPLWSEATGRQTDHLPRLAATTVLLRPASAGLEVFLVKRAHGSDFMGGAHVFPGGKTDACDGDEAWRARVHGDLPALLARLEPTPGRPLEEGDALGAIVAAARELFEEAGVLLAVDAGGAPVSLDGELEAARGRVHDDATAFGPLLDARGLRLDLSSLCYFAHWVTPSLERRRFDARFFLARLPAGQEARVDEAETVAGDWLSPEAALAAVAAGEMILPPPTLRTVEWLRGFADLPAAFAGARAASIAAILPKVAQTEDGVGVLLPWDAAYADAEGEDYLGAGQRADASGAFGGSRIVMAEGRWRSLDRR